MYEEIKVFIEETNTFVSLKLTKEQIERASRDSDYLQQLVNIEASAPSAPILEASMSQPSYSSSQTNLSSQSDNCDDGDSTKSLFIWTTPCVQLLLSLYEEHQDEFSNGSKRHKKIWEEIASKMKDKSSNFSMNGNQCQSKLNGLKKTFKKIIDHNNVSGNDRMTWPYFDRMNEIFGSTGWAQPKALASETGPTPPASIEKTPKKRKLDVLVEKYLKEAKEARQMKAEEKELEIRNKIKIKEENFNKLLEMKERQHSEKMQMLKELVTSLKK